MSATERRLEKKSHPGMARTLAREKIYFRGVDYFRDVLKAVHKARKYVDIETYIYEPGRLADQVAAALVGAQKRGVRVRLLVDGVGSPDFLNHYGPRLEKARGAFPYLPFLADFLFFHLQPLPVSSAGAVLSVRAFPL